MLETGATGANSKRPAQPRSVVYSRLHALVLLLFIALIPMTPSKQALILLHSAPPLSVQALVVRLVSHLLAEPKCPASIRANFSIWS